MRVYGRHILKGMRPPGEHQRRGSLRESCSGVFVGEPTAKVLRQQLGGSRTVYMML